MSKKIRSAAGVLGRDEVDLLEDADRPQREIFKVADGRGDHVEGAGHARYRASTGAGRRILSFPRGVAREIDRLSGR